MRNILIITDSCADINKDFMLPNIKIIPFGFYMKGDILNTYKDIPIYSNTELYKFLKAGAEAYIVTVRKSSILEALLEARDKDLDVICIHSSSKINPGVDKAFMDAVNEFINYHNGTRVSVIDSSTCSVSLGLLVYRIAAMANDGVSFDEIVNYVLKNKKYYKLDLFVPDIKYLLAKGLIGKNTEIINNITKHNPILSFGNNGGLKSVGLVKSDDFIIDSLFDRVKGKIDLDENISVVHTKNDSMPFELSEKIKSTTQKDVFISEMGKADAIHFGPNVLGLAYKKR